jgi:hypothetical protein
MRPMMSSTGTLYHWRPETMAAISSLLAASSHHICASITALMMAMVAMGWASTQSARMPSTFSGCFDHSSPVEAAVKPMP